MWALGEERATRDHEKIWQILLHNHPRTWKELYNEEVRTDQNRLDDDPVPRAVLKALRKIRLHKLAEALKEMPVRATGGNERVSDRIKDARRVLRDIEDELWKSLLAKTRWRSPLLIMDGAHHLKNPLTLLAIAI